MKRDFQIADETMCQISCTLWGEKATNMELNVGDVMALKGVKVSDYSGRSLSTLQSSAVDRNPEIPESFQLRGWFETNHAALGNLHSLTTERSGGGGGAGGAVTGSGPLSVLELRETFSSMREKNMGQSEKGDIAVIKACITNIRTDDPNKLWYPSCGSVSQSMDGKPCLKKATLDPSTNTWACDKGCHVEQPIYRYILTASVTDCTGQEFATFFDQEGAQVLGRSANDMCSEVVSASLAASTAMPEDSAFSQTIREAYFKDYLLTVKAKTEMVRDEAKLKFSIVRVKDIEYARECKVLAAGIKKYFAA